MSTKLAAQRYTTAAIACVILACLTSSQNILITWTKRHGGYDYNYVTVTFMTELCKLIMAFVFLYREQRELWNGHQQSTALYDAEKGMGTLENGHAVRRVDLSYELSWAGFRDRLPFALPALIYFGKNNLVFRGLKELNPVQFQLLGNLKILSTAVLFRVIMKRPMSDLAWIAVLLMSIGLTFTQLKTNPTADTAKQTLDVTARSMGVMISIAVLSGLGSIVTEWLMKSNAIQNIWLYFYGALFNLVAIVSDDYEAISTNGFFYGYSIVTWCVILNNSSSGIAVSAIMKYANSIVKLFTFAVSLILTTLLSVLFFDFQFTLPFVLGSTVVFIAIYLYSRK